MFCNCVAHQNALTVPQFRKLAALHDPEFYQCKEFALVAYSVALRHRTGFRQAVEGCHVDGIIEFFSTAVAQSHGVGTQKATLDAMFSLAVNARPRHMRFLLSKLVDSGGLAELCRLSSPVLSAGSRNATCWYGLSERVSRKKLPEGVAFHGNSGFFNVVIQPHVNQEELIQKWFQERASRRFGDDGKWRERPSELRELYPFWRYALRMHNWHCVRVLA